MTVVKVIFRRISKNSRTKKPSVKNSMRASLKPEKTTKTTKSRYDMALHNNSSTSTNRAAHEFKPII